MTAFLSGATRWMVVKQHFDHSLRANGKRFLSSLKASNRYSDGYLASLETTLGMAALYTEEQGWPDVQEITTEHIEDYLSYLQDRKRWFCERTYVEPKKLSKGHINAQYRRLNRFFNWLVEEDPETYLRTLGEEDTIDFHRQLSQEDRLGRAPSSRRIRHQRDDCHPKGRL